MGGALVVEAVRATALDNLAPQSRMVLLVMAAHAFDKPRADNPGRVYWLGRRLLALEVFGDTHYGSNSPGRKGVNRAIQDLTKRGLIRVHAVQPGSVTAYAVLPGGGVHGDPH